VSFRILLSLILVLLVNVVQVGVAQAYSGPGSGISFIGALISVLVSFVLVIGAILAWPFRAWLKRRRKLQAARNESGKAL
jgi:hypothetical protein